MADLYEVIQPQIEFRDADGNTVVQSIVRKWSDEGTYYAEVTSGGSGGGDASAANQTTMITHLSAIETAVEGTVAVAVGSVALPSTIVHGQKTVTAAGTEEALGASTVLASGVRVKALHANTGSVYVGANPVTSSTGFVLTAGEEVFIEVANLATVYIDVSVNGEGVSYIGG